MWGAVNYQRLKREKTFKVVIFKVSMFSYERCSVVNCFDHNNVDVKHFGLFEEWATYMRSDHCLLISLSLFRLFLLFSVVNEVL